MTSEVGSSNGLLAPWLLTLEDGIPRPGPFFITSARCIPCSTTVQHFPLQFEQQMVSLFLYPGIHKYRRRPNKPPDPLHL